MNGNEDDSVGFYKTVVVSVHFCFNKFQSQWNGLSFVVFVSFLCVYVCVFVCLFVCLFFL